MIEDINKSEVMGTFEMTLMDFIGGLFKSLSRTIYIIKVGFEIMASLQGIRNLFTLAKMSSQMALVAGRTDSR